jgi:histidinol phosphatase-like PHP family hydrolase/predicted nuclease with RNAse H fold/dephospho-CoA kinase
MFDFEIACYLYRVAFLYEKVHCHKYKARAYFKAALAVDGYANNIEKLYKDRKLRSLPSIGASIEKNINEIIESKHLILINELLGNITDSIFDLYEYANIKEKVLKTLIDHGVFSFAHIAKIIEQRVAYLSQSDIELLRVAIKDYTSRCFQYAHIYELANELILFLQNSHLVDGISMSDGLYLHKETLKSGEIICVVKYGVEDFLIKMQSIPLFRFISSGENCITLERFGIPFNIHVLPNSEFSRKIQMLQIEREKYIYKSHHKNTVSHFYGDLHLHTNWSDGLHSIEQMRDMAIELGYSYIAITDHSQSLKPWGMSELDTLTQIKKIREINTRSNIPILAGIEVDILANGSLDLPESILKEFDIVIAAVHSHFNQPPFVLIERMSRALSNKYVNILAHPMGRLLGRPGKPTVHRKEIQLIFDDLLRLCRENNVAMEINCFPERFDLSLDNAKKAIFEGVKISVGTDSHSMYHMNCAKYALEALGFAGIPAEVILNCQPLDELKNILSIRRGANKKDISSIFEEKIKNFKCYFSENDKICSGHIKSIGIDLTGSEEKASGFAILSGSKAETVSVLTDDEMVKRISDVDPAIISIDSPLSLPEGRCCSNKDCECAKYGIMRYCELTLKRFGIGVYPCLIDSMVSLTMRGIKLAARFRGLGFKVIESYPGVAQDLLHIPRKRKGLEHLLSGIKNFGIDGIRENITHDEADAITSALVGYFYVDDQYVGVGNDKENYLIIPKLKTELSGKGIVIGLTGHIAAGKTTVAEYLRFKHGFTSMRFSKLIGEKYNVSSRDDLQRIGLEIAKDSVKQKELSDLMINKMKKGENYVIDGIRQLVDYNNLSFELENKFISFSIEAPPNIRASRYNKLYPDVSEDKFAEMDAHPVESFIDSLAYKSNHRIINSKSYKELMNKVDLLLSKLI